MIRGVFFCDYDVDILNKYKLVQTNKHKKIQNMGECQ